jgi:hypothetical protein
MLPGFRANINKRANTQVRPYIIWANGVYVNAGGIQIQVELRFAPTLFVIFGRTGYI